MNRLPIYLDYDNCLVNSTTVHVKWCNENIRHLQDSLRHFPTQMLRDYYGPNANDFWYTGKSYEFIRPHHGAVPFFKKLNKNFKVVIVTMNLPPHIFEEKQYHAKLHFGIRNDQMIHVEPPFNKHLHTKDGVLVDDHAGLIQGHIENNGMHGIVFNHDSKYGWAKQLPHRLSLHETNFNRLYQTLCRLERMYHNRKVITFAKTVNTR